LKNKTFKAGSLLFTIYVSLVLYLVAASFILLYFLYSKSINQHITQSKLKYLCSSAANLYLSDPNANINKQLLLDGYAESVDIQMKKNLWGFYEIVEIESSQGTSKCKGSFLVGGAKFGLNSLYIADNNSFVSVSGNTQIEGNIVVPGAHIQRKNFYGSISPFDSLRRSKTSLPKINQQIIKHLPLRANLQDNEFYQNNRIDYQELRARNISKPFTDSALIIYSKSSLSIADIELKGKIIIYSETKIDIYSSSQLSDVIVVAPEIHIHMGFEGSGQFISDSLIYTGKNCKFKYPTVIATVSKYNSKIIIDESCILPGAVILVTKHTGNNSSVEIKKNTTVYGLVYSMQSCKLAGNIYGGVYANSIHSPDIISNRNIISNVSIRYSDLRDEFIFPILFINQQRDIVDFNYLYTRNKKTKKSEL
jgi:hypothetical protein